MGTSDPPMLRHLAATRRINEGLLGSIASDAKDAKHYSEIIVQELKPDALTLEGDAHA